MAPELNRPTHISGNWFRVSGVPGLIGRKRVDTAVFKSGTTIPQSLEASFEDASGGRRRAPIGGHLGGSVLVGDESFPARLQRWTAAGRTHPVLALHWNDSRLIHLLKETFATTYARLSEDAATVDDAEAASAETAEVDAEYIDIFATDRPLVYRLEFVTAEAIRVRETVLRDLESLHLEESYVEGEPVTHLVSTYERSPDLRSAAIAIHGTRCQACDMSFAESFGELGEGYIEVHHLKPVADYKGEVKVDPRTDMAVVCSNCHRMLHRHAEEPRSVEELTAVMRANSRM